MARLDYIDTRLGGVEKALNETLPEQIAGVDDRVSNLRRDLEANGMLPPAEEAV